MKYLVRLDDITEGTNWDNFHKLEETFDRYNIKPILGVVPDNNDKSIIAKPYIMDRNMFFKKIKSCDEKGYTIAMHGVKHILYETQKKSIVNINNYGEFVNLTYQEKLEQFKYGIGILRKHNIAVNMYMPPAHWIDEDIIDILKKLQFKYVTDGLFFYPKKINNIWFIPQQLWRPRDVKFPGIFTLCLHINNNSTSEIENIINFIKLNHEKFTSVNELKLNENIFITLLNKFSNILFISILKLKRFFK